MIKEILVAGMIVLVACFMFPIAFASDRGYDASLNLGLPVPEFVPYEDLRWYDLQGVNLTGVDLYGVLFRYADLRAADLQDANLTFADLSSANFTEALGRNADLYSVGKLLTRTGN